MTVMQKVAFGAFQKFLSLTPIWHPTAFMNAKLELEIEAQIKSLNRKKI